MIFWEKVTPLFDVCFDGVDFDYWEWEDPTGWEPIDGNVMDWSQPLSEMVVNGFVKERLGTLMDAVPYRDHLVIYGSVGIANGLNQWKVILLATRLTCFERFGTAPPLWWGGHDDPLYVLLERVNARVEVIKEIRDRVEIRRSFDRQEGPPLEVVEGYCSLCGLRMVHHVPHKVPGFSAMGSSQEGMRAYFQAFRGHFQPALQKMSNEELIGMPMATTQRYLSILKIEIDRRLNAVPPVKDRLERLLDDEDLLDEG